MVLASGILLVDSNTTNVNVKSLHIKLSENYNRYSNTTNVKVKFGEVSARINRINAFKYNQC